MKQVMDTMMTAGKVAEGYKTLTSDEIRQRWRADLVKASGTDLARTVQQLDTIARDLKRVLEQIEAYKREASEAAIDWFVREGVDKVSVDGVTVSPRQEYWPNYKWRDLIPEGCEGDKDIEDAAREQGKQRMIDALREAGHDEIVKEQVNAQTLRSLLAGPDAPRDATGEPVIPDGIAQTVELNPRMVISIRRG